MVTAADRRVRALPGRLRIEVIGLRRNPALAADLDAVLRREPGVLNTSRSLITGTALVYYDPRVLSELRLIGIVEQLERTRGPSAGRRARRGLLSVQAIQPALAVILGAGTVSGITILRAPAEAQENLGIASAMLAVASGYPQIPESVDLSVPLDLARVLAYGATDNLLGLAASAVSSYGALAEHLALLRAARAIDRVVHRNIPAAARSRYTRMLREDPRHHGNPLPPTVGTYVETASFLGILGGLLAVALQRSWLAGLAVLAAANPRTVHEGATTSDAAALQRAAGRRFFIRRSGIVARLAEVSVLLLDEPAWEAAGAHLGEAVMDLVAPGGGAVVRLGERGAERTRAVREWQDRGHGVAVIAADPSSVAALRAADLSVVVLEAGRTPPSHAADIIVAAPDLPAFPEILAAARGEAVTNRQNRTSAAILGGSAALLAALGLLPLGAASASYSLAVLLTTLNGRRVAWWPSRPRTDGRRLPVLRPRVRAERRAVGTTRHGALAPS